MIRVGNVKIWMKYVHTFGAGRLKRQAETTLLFQYITSIIEITNLNVEGCKSYLPVFSIICHYFTVNATGMANMLICRHFANLVLNLKCWVAVVCWIFFWDNCFPKICLSGIQVGYQTVCIQITPTIFSLNLASAVDKVYQRNSFSRQIFDALKD